MSSDSLSHDDCTPMKWWERHFGNLVHVLFILIAAWVFSVPARAQRDGVIYEKVREVERHLDNSDQIAKDNKLELQNQINDIRKMAEDDHETLDVYKYVGGTISGLLTIISLLGYRLQFNRGKESNG